MFVFSAADRKTRSLSSVPYMHLQPQDSCKTLTRNSSRYLDDRKSLKSSSSLAGSIVSTLKKKLVGSPSGCDLGVSQLSRDMDVIFKGDIHSVSAYASKGFLER
ncbi:hypothetical protein HDU91_006393, partial [Kappamyces sp. JEL0680]